MVPCLLTLVNGCLDPRNGCRNLKSYQTRCLSRGAGRAAPIKTKLKLTGVARASLEELLLDYQDFLRQRALRLWEVSATGRTSMSG
jgi:hypothetical protein